MGRVLKTAGNFWVIDAHDSPSLDFHLAEIVDGLVDLLLAALAGFIPRAAIVMYRPVQLHIFTKLGQTGAEPFISDDTHVKIAGRPAVPVEPSLIEGEAGAPTPFAYSEERPSSPEATPGASAFRAEIGGDIEDPLFHDLPFLDIPSEK
jgi:hypothetical protein